jgi:eukaryotic-like serine/threonine-protein kinase
VKPEAWARIENVLAQALDLPRDQRSKFLDEACAGDSALRMEVESLLAEHESEPGFLESPAFLNPNEPAPEPHPEQIGPYRILRVLGRGGMGQVYLAEREAAGVRIQVAVKVMRRGLDTEDLIARFRTEGRILASLNHPNIARLIDVGATGDGLPYFVMEYVDGAPIFEYCDSRKLTVRARIELLQRICDAVQQAHRSLIVHRDIKPLNILVTGDGIPKLLDFGIAKILDPDESQAAPRTRGEIRILTPEYAAPEQIEGKPLTTACDVYALGVLAYELLAGEHPFASGRGRGRDIEPATLRVDPAAPSTRANDTTATARSATGVQLQRQLRGDLDTIVLKTLRYEPEERYPSALSLSEDLHRYLTGLPVQARQATARYRIRKFVGRNRIAVTAAAALFTVLATSTTITLRQSARIREESRRVLRERDKASEVRNFLLEMFGTTGADQATGDSVTARQLLDRRAQSLAQQHPDDQEMRAEMMYVLAEGYEKLGLLTDAERHARASLELRRTLFGNRHADVVASLDLLGWILHQRRQRDEAATYLREAVAVGRALFPPEGDLRLARALNDLGIYFDVGGTYDTAITLFRESIDMRRRLAGESNMGIAVTTSNLSVTFYRQGKLDSAVAYAQSALSIFRNVLGEDHQRTTIVQNNLASFQTAMGDHEGAVRQNREILARRTRLFGAQHPFAAFSMTSLAGSLIRMKQYDEADSLSRAAIVIQQRSETPLPELVTSIRHLALIAGIRQQDREALRYYREALDAARRAFGNNHLETAQGLMFTARSYEGVGENARAESAFREARDVAARAVGAKDRRTTGINLSLIEFLQRQGKREVARSEFQQLRAGLDSALFTADDALGKRLRAVADSIGLPPR